MSDSRNMIKYIYIYMKYDTTYRLIYGLNREVFYFNIESNEIHIHFLETEGFLV